MMDYLLLGGGLLVLIIGANLLVRGGSQIAARLRISPLVIGSTVVAIGTSVPELAVGIDAAVRGNTALVTGNIVGTNIVNLLLILGLSAAIRAVRVSRQTIRLDAPMVAVVSVLLLVMSLNGSLTGIEGLVLIGMGLMYTIAIIRYSRRESAAVRAEFDHEYQVPEPGAVPRPVRMRSTVLDVVRLVGGIAIVVVGAHWLVGGAVQIAAELGISDAVIGLTVVAIGTSAPELVTTVVATIKGERSLAIGNLLGSSVYNIVFILGVTLLVAPTAIEVPAQVLAVDMVAMAAVAVLAVPVFVTGRRISRPEGSAMVLVYLAYLVYLILART